jgi:hypothetical protein
MIHWTRVFYLGSRNETNGIMLNNPDSRNRRPFPHSF